MKAIRFLLAGFLFMTLSSQAQVSVNVNIGAPPVWGPVGYAPEIRYYYLPDIEVYYDIPTSMFIYFDGGGWIRAAYLPYRYRHYDLYGAYKVCLDDYGPNPYIYYKKHKVKYYHGYRGGYQRSIGPRPQVVYNGPRGGYYRDRDDNDRNDDRNYYRREERRNDNYRNDNYRNDYRQNNEFRGGRDNGNGNGHEPGRGHGNGNGNGRGHGNGKRG
ncbi:hypothetical protein LZZ90_10635 [Flavobacterium sp. SM15]|uniref:hypothetical protein n=1 Tax=Flavobacterium sp. SM15 TaxID=2908005 RepID=UPI001EDAB581|nr:hypothetical protein [Flavobacterium sp. SM15]MCG2611963.1 hypothetical protein [Flavobacterium sp. SM15]